MGQTKIHSNAAFNLSAPIRFNPAELGAILAVYGAGVQKAQWRDYSIDSNAQGTTFSVIDRDGAGQVMIRKSISRMKGLNPAAPDYYALYDKNGYHRKTDDFRQALSLFGDEAAAPVAATVPARPTLKLVFSQ